MHMCVCVFRRCRNTKRYFLLLLLMATRGGEGVQREMKVEVCMKGSVSMVTTPSPFFSAPLKNRPPSTNVHLYRHARGGRRVVEGRRTEQGAGGGA